MKIRAYGKMRVKNDSKNSRKITAGDCIWECTKSIAMISHVSPGSIFCSLPRCVRQNIKLHSPVDSTLVLPPSKLYRICDRTQARVQQPGEMAGEAWGVVKAEGRYRGGREFDGESFWFTFVLSSRRRMCGGKLNPRQNPQSCEILDGNLVTYKREGVKKES